MASAAQAVEAPVSDTMIERVARALYEKRIKVQLGCEAGRSPNPKTGLYTLTWEQLGSMQEAEREIARAALSALREPSEAMIVPRRIEYSGRTWLAGSDELRAAWQAMIDAALESK